uniref:butyrophilin subfamily 1 member A1-like isoform X2 n=1 Tax=Pristiophorus japonicus TaxID=55135 RepID=UPI00398F1DC2
MEPWALLLILFLWIQSTLADVFRVTGPEAPIVAMVGGVVVLECQLIPEQPSADMEVQWVRRDSKLNTPVHLYRSGQDVSDNQDPAYRGRTALFKDEFKQGNVSLQLTDVKLEDQGDYLCMVEQHKIIEHTPVQLKVASLGLRPAIRLAGYSSHGLRMHCDTSGWYPAPMIHWAGGANRNMTDKGEAAMAMSKDGLYTMSSTIEVASDGTNTFKCLVHSTILKHSEEFSIHIPDEFFPRRSRFFTAFILFLLVFLGLLAIAGYFYLRKWKQSKELHSRPTLGAEVQTDVGNARNNLRQEQVLSKTAAERVLGAAVAVTFDPETANPYLAISADRLVVTFSDTWQDRPPNPKRFDSRLFVMASEGYQSGCHYWEVLVASKPDWDLGVVKESTPRNDWVTLSPENGYWTIGKRGHAYEVNDVTPKPITGKATAQIIGIHLNWDQGEIRFYNADNMTHIYTFNVEFSEKIYPFFSPWGSREIMTISPL